LSDDGKNKIALTKPKEANGTVFAIDKVPFGKYTLKAEAIGKKTDATSGANTDVPLTATKQVEINASKQEYAMELQK
jgi:hypothetical protein